MRRAFAIAIAVAALATPAAADIYVSGDPGGPVQTYLARVQAVRASGDRVIIDGPCNSACTLWLTLPAAQVCATSRTVFGFHAATNSLGLPDPATTDMIWNAYPPHVRVAVGQRGGLWLTTVYVRGTELARRCGRTQ